MHRSLALTALSVAACSGAQHVSSPTAAPLRCPLTVTGNAQVPTDALVAAACCPRDGSVSDDAEVRVEAVYIDRGFLDVSLSDTPRPGADGRTWHAFTIAREGTPYRYRRIDVVDAAYVPGDSVGEPTKLRSMVHASPGQFFSRSAIIRDYQAILDVYKDEGYAAAETLPDMNVDAATHTVDLVIPIQRGPRYTIEDVRFVGGARIGRGRLLETVQVRPGERFNEARMQASKRALARIPGVTDVVLDTEEGSSDGRIIITFEVSP